MDKPARYKAKNKKPPPKPIKNPKRKKSDGPTCSMFLSELSRKLALKKRQEEELPTNIVQNIIESITNALPFIFSKKPPEKKDSPMKIETLQTFAPELLPNDTLDVPKPALSNIVVPDTDVLVAEVDTSPKRIFRIPKMPVVTSEVFKLAGLKKRVPTEDASVNTGGDHDVASEIARHVGTLKKISLIAEEFNQKTAKNLKDIVDSVQEDLMKKLEEIQAEQKMIKIEEEPMEVEQSGSKQAE